MSCSLASSEFTYRVPTSGTLCGYGYWQFTVVGNLDGTLGIKNIKSPQGSLCASGVQIPQEVWDCMEEAKQQVENLLSMTSAINGILNFNGDTILSVIFAAALPNANYRVDLSLQDFIAARVVNKTTVGFDVEVNVTYTGAIGYDVFL